MSDVHQCATTFFDLYRDGRATAEQIHDFIEAWHESGDTEQRELVQYLGMTEDEYSIWLASAKALPLLAAARREGRSVVDVVRSHLAEMQHAARPTDRTAIYILTHWLQKRAGAK